MDRIESNTINSFSLVRKDIMKLQDNFMGLKVAHARILEKLAKLESRKVSNPTVKVIRVKEKAVPKKKAVKRSVTKKNIYLASKEGKKFHDPGCVSLKNVPRSKLTSYSSKNKAISKGLQPCGICIPR